MLSRLARLIHRNVVDWNDAQAISAEIFGTERLLLHSRSLAASQAVSDRSLSVRSIVQRLGDNSAALLNAYRDICTTIADGKTVTPASEWLIDNYHLVEEHVRQTLADLPEGFYRQLPKLAEGPLAGHPRIFGLVWAYVAHTDSRFDPLLLTDFVAEYQKVQPLTIGELWAVAISLRLILIENLRRIVDRMQVARRARAEADALADRILIRVDLDGSPLFSQGEEPTVTQPFAVQLIQRLRDHDGSAPAALDWLRQKADALGYSIDEAVIDEHHRQAAANVTVRNIVTSLRLVSDVNWESWFDSVSLVDQLLRNHETYAAMDFASRTTYRTAVEELSRGSSFAELEIASRALADGAIDPGYHLIGPGRATLEATIAFRAPPLRRIRNLIRRFALGGYLGAIIMISALLMMMGIVAVARPDIPTLQVAALAFLALLPVLEAGIAIVNFTVTRLLDASTLPGLAFRDGVPSEFRTLVAVPALLTSRGEIEELAERLEVHYLSNSTGELHFALLTDWTDSATETAASDDTLLAEALARIAKLNERYGGERFLLLHRGRQWNPSQGKWMGWERKRGKLHELNRLLRGATDTSYIVIGGKLPEDFRFVLTLDADTKLPRDAARRLVGKLAHPLNSPRLDSNAGRVTQGYAVLQPRVTPSLPTGHHGSMFQRIFSTPRGTDPYVFAVSDVYQDLFDEGSFAGKGIYDIDAFEAALAGRVPENTMLSHDLFEGIFARCALATDIEVVEEYPECYAVASARSHRWVRGDWQLLPWILSRRGAIPSLGLLKIVDNLRRSLTPPALFASLLAGWSVLPPAAALAWTLFMVAVLLAGPFLPAFSHALAKRRPVTFRSRAASVAGEFRHAATFVATNLLFLAHQSWLMLDAIGRTLYRLFYSRKNLLEWAAAAQLESSSATTIGAHYKIMLASVAAGFATAAIALYRSDSFSPAVAVFAIAWCAAPLAALRMSRSPKLEDGLEGAPADRRSLRMVARRTWRFFETFVVPGDNMLPPDNFQEDPRPAIAHRTSPTNIGLYLVSLASAREFGWLGLSDTVARLEATLDTIRRMETCNGHLYNWYDTENLRPLDPRYVSTVDSGNLAGHLVALANFCDNWRTQIDNTEAIFDGMDDVIGLFTEHLAAISDDRRALRSMRKQLQTQVSALSNAVTQARDAPEYASVRLIELAVQASNLHAKAGLLAAELDTGFERQLVEWANSIRDTIETHFRDFSLGDDERTALRVRLAALAEKSRSFAYGMEFGFLLDPQRNLLSIGYRVPEDARDESCYDLLASEARLASFFAIAKGDLRTRHWFRLGRTVTEINSGAALVSWSGSMFEYLMPSLVMRAPSGGLLDQTTRLIVARQMQYAASHGIPWGISESAFNARDIAFTYQYSNFGVPGLGLKRGLADNLVVAPYATGLAAMVAPRRAAQNFQALTQAGGLGVYGFYEALDYTPSRLRKGEDTSVVRAYFAHHQGMTISAILNAVRNGEMRSRFHAEPAVRATELLLQERAPREVPVTFARAEEVASSANVRDAVETATRKLNLRHLSPPVTQLLANNQLSMMITAAGSGYTTWNGLAVTRWREDSVCDDWGHYVYLRDARSGRVWSAGHMPVASPPDHYAATFSDEKVEIVRTDGNFTTTMECIVSPEDDAEARRVTVLNSGLTVAEIEITSYAELVLAAVTADAAHPAFSKLFVETEFLPEIETLLATRRRRSPTDAEIWVAQFMLVDGAKAGPLEFETDRARFIGTGKSVRNPAVIGSPVKLSNSAGTTLDTIFAIRRRLRIPAGRQARVTYWTVVAGSREAALDLVDRHRQEPAFNRAMMLAWTQAQIGLRHLSINAEEAQLYQTLASPLIYMNSALRASARTLASDIGPQSALWPHGISGDRPILLVRIDEIDDIELIRTLLHAFEYWKSKHLPVDLVILNDRRSSYAQDLQGAIDAMVRNISTPGERNKIYTLRADLVSPDTLRVLPAIARVVLYGRRGSLATQLLRFRENPIADKPVAKPPKPDVRSALEPIDTGGLEFFNGFGGFDADGKEYVTLLNAGRPLPAPWINVIANRNFGFHCSADGGGYAWYGNSKENQITPWSNDPVSDRPGEVFYVRCDSEDFLVSPTLSPLMSDEGTHLARHGFGYSTFERQVRDMRLELTQFVPLEDAIKMSRLRITNLASVPRSLSVTYYADWVLGSSRSAAAPYVTTAIDEDCGAMFARNRWSIETTEQVAFADLAGSQTSWTGDRHEFLGPCGDLAAPLALARGIPLSNRTGGGLDPCCALRTVVTVQPGQSTEINILLGAAPNEGEARALVKRYRKEDPKSVLAAVKSFWADTLGAVTVATPDRSFDIIMNGWMLYQALCCRMWARSGFYQASGAYGFRDQLQDAMALLSAQPAIAREHILRAAARQFIEGDFQHWWLPITGMGVRTRISDDAVWLPYCVSLYVKTTGDFSILAESVDFIEGQSVEAGQHDAFFQPALSDESASLCEHCVRALDKSLAIGVHGLPLIGGGDWNDGMNRVGDKGQGESVWLGWLLSAVLRDFATIAENQGQANTAARWRTHAKKIVDALEQHGWDGNWYRRAFYDDGTPLGSAESQECRIDAIAQSWAVISGMAPPARAASAMEESYRQLVDRNSSLLLLFTPPFDKTTLDPGYIKAYPPGIRENGGQYSHGAIWSIFAHAELDQPDRATELFHMLNPINHAGTQAQAMAYKVEPYVIAADVYSAKGHAGRGGWTWYTGSAAWMYRAGIEAVLGVTREGNRLRIRPRLPAGWDSYGVTVQFNSTRYELEIVRHGAGDDLPANVEAVSAREFIIRLEDSGGIQKISLPAIVKKKRLRLVK
jgi:cyclic beta-1,2-glucan synthetase